MLGSSIPHVQILMAIYLICSSLSLGTIIGATAFLNACTSSSQTLGSAANAEAAAGTATETQIEAVDQASSSSTAQDSPQTVRTTHDVFHSKSIEVPAGTAVPAVTVRVEQDEVSGWNLYVGTANFTFEPAKVNGESSATAGHAELYINDAPVQRIYSTWTHLPTLPSGDNVLRVTLNANGHETLTTQGAPIEDSVTINVYDPNLPS